MVLSMLAWSTRDLFSEWRCRMLLSSRTACAPPALSPISHCPVIWSMMTWSESWSRVSCWTRPSLNLTCHTIRSANQALARSPSTFYSPRSSLIWTLVTTVSTTKDPATCAKLSRSTSLSWILTSSWIALTTKRVKKCALTCASKSRNWKDFVWQPTCWVTCSVKACLSTSATISRSKS